jgi:glycosyltransferase involved in cell wall biosynthesis
MTSETDSRHIAVFVSNLNIGGAERVAVTLANEFSRRGAKVDLIVMNSDGPMAVKVAPDVKIIDFRKKRGRFSLVGLVSYIRNSRPDVVVSLLTVPNLLLGLTRLFFLNSRPRLVGSEHSYVTDIGYRGDRTLISSVLYSFSARLGYRLLDAVIVPSNGIAERLRTQRLVASKKVHVIPNPIDLRWVEASEVTESRSSSCIELLAVGRLEVEKDYPTMIRSVHLLSKSVNVILNILGEGNSRSNLQILINELGLTDRIFLIGQVSELSHWYQRADILLLSSIYEGFGNVLVEALAHGVPVVSTDCQAGPREIISNNSYGKLVPVGDHVAMAEAIKDVLKQTHDKKILKSRAEDFESSKVCNRYLEVLKLNF